MAKQPKEYEFLDTPMTEEEALALMGSWKLERFEVINRQFGNKMVRCYNLYAEGSPRPFVVRVDVKVLFDAVEFEEEFGGKRPYPGYQHDPVHRNEWHD